MNLRKAGYPLWVHARRPECMTPFSDAGAIACMTSAQVAAQSDIIFIMVTDTVDVEHVIFGKHGIIEAVKPGSIVVDMSTISPGVTRDIARRLAQEQVSMLDAPVSGGQQGAIDGTLSIMVGGKPDSVARVMPMFECMGKNIVHVGDHGAGQVTKMCNQVVIAQTINAVGEAFLIATASGVDPAKVRQALSGGFAGSRVLETHGQRMLEQNYQPGFKAKLHRKDMRIAMEAASELGVALPGAALATQMINALVGNGYGELDSAALHMLQKQICGMK
jgi:2-hydroxy-3-oxopropionate reductase